MASLYVHIPFCLGRCTYCSFNSYPGMEDLYSRYVKAVNKEIVENFFSGRKEKVTTIFFGGGTPSVLSVELLRRIISCCRQYLNVDEGAEISIEVNPKTVDFLKLMHLRQAGFNRISIGIQSFIDKELQALGRLHTAQESWDCVTDAFTAGFNNVSIDLMSGLPDQSEASWRWNLETALTLNPQHLSLYQLTIEEGTPLAKGLEKGALNLPGEEEIVSMDLVSHQLCEQEGMIHYEISNYALPGKECRHNLNYWHNGEYISVGAGAVGYFQGKRSKNEKDPYTYCELIETSEKVVVESEILSTTASFRETVVVGLRMNKGVSYGNLHDRFGIHLRDYYGKILDPLLREGFVEFTRTHFRLTKKGRPVANQIMSQLV